SGIITPYMVLYALHDALVNRCRAAQRRRRWPSRGARRMSPRGDENPRATMGSGSIFSRGARSVRILGRARALSLAAARDPRWMGQPPPTGGHRVPRGGEPRPWGAAEGAARPVDRRPAPILAHDGRRSGCRLNSEDQEFRPGSEVVPTP